MAKAWYGYVEGNPLNPESYHKISITPEFGPGLRLGAVYAKDDGSSRPQDFSTALKVHITNALTTGVSQFTEENVLVVSMN